MDERDEQTIGAYFHVLNDLERIGDHAENFHEIGQEMQAKRLAFSDIARDDIKEMNRVAGHIVNVGYSICNPVGSQKA